MPFKKYKPQSRNGVSLSNAAQASHRTRPAAAVRYRTWVNWYLLIASATVLAGCISHRRQRRPMGRTVCIAGRLFNSLTANDRWHRIHRSQQRSLSLGKGLMLAETVAQTDDAWHKQTLRIISIWW